MNETRRNQLGFIDRAVSMQDPESEEFKQLAYWARVWVQAALPHSNPGPRTAWTRPNGAFTLTVQPGIELIDGFEVNHGIPYGNVPRLLMCWMCTEAVRTGERKLFLGESLSEFMRKLELGAATGGRWGTIPRLKDQMNRLFQARICYRWENENVRARKSLQIATKEVLWWSDFSPNHPTLFDSYIELDYDFFNEIVTRPVPIKLEALRLLKRSPLSLDLYTWLTHRVFGLKKIVPIPWAKLQQQIGAEYGTTKNFAAKCKAALKKIHIVYPELRIETPPGRLLVYPSPTHVSVKQHIVR